MRTDFYVSGFLYHSPSQQILLQQSKTGDDIKFTFFREKSHNGDSPETVFQRCIETALGVPINASSIHEVYNYIHESLGEHFIFYVESTDAIPAAYVSKNKTEWFSLSKLSKYAMSEQTRHDIIVGERVIRFLAQPPNPEAMITRH